MKLLVIFFAISILNKGDCDDCKILDKLKGKGNPPHIYVSKEELNNCLTRQQEIINTFEDTKFVVNLFNEFNNRFFFSFTAERNDTLFNCYVSGKNKKVCNFHYFPVERRSNTKWFSYIHFASTVSILDKEKLSLYIYKFKEIDIRQYKEKVIIPPCKMYRNCIIDTIRVY